MSGFKTITAAALHESMSQPRSVALIDVRNPAEFADGHAVGAVSLPLDALDAEQLQHRFGAQAGVGETVFLICASGMRAQLGAEVLRAQGLDNVAVVSGGTQSWADLKLPLARESQRLPLERQTQIALGVVLLLITAKALLLHPLFFAVAGLLGAGLIAAGITARCGLTAVLARMPWNQVRAGGYASGA